VFFLTHKLALQAARDVAVFDRWSVDTWQHFIVINQQPICAELAGVKATTLNYSCKEEHSGLPLRQEYCDEQKSAQSTFTEKALLRTVQTNLPPLSVAYRGGRVFGVFKPPRNSEDIGGVLDRMSKKNRRLDFLL